MFTEHEDDINWQYSIKLREEIGLNAESLTFERRLTGVGVCICCAQKGMLVRHLNPDPDTCPECRAGHAEPGVLAAVSGGKACFSQAGPPGKHAFLRRVDERQRRTG